MHSYFLFKLLELETCVLGDTYLPYVLVHSHTASGMTENNDDPPLYQQHNKLQANGKAQEISRNNAMGLKAKSH